MLKAVTFYAFSAAVAGHPFVGEHAGKSHIDNGNGISSTRLEAGPPKMNQFNHHIVNIK